MRTPQEIEDELDELAYFDYCCAQGGDERGEMVIGVRLDMLNWLLQTDHKNLYARGEKLYRSGVRYQWSQPDRAYKKS